MKRIIFLLPALMLGACAALQPGPQPSPTPGLPFVIRQEENLYAPRLEDVNLKQADVVLTSLNLSERYEQTPIRAELYLLGSIPNVCSELRIKVNPPNGEYQINIEVYSVADIGQECDDVFQQFEVNLLLGEYSPGQYAIWVNGNFVGNMASYQ
jgi:hypothetical protein